MRLSSVQAERSGLWSLGHNKAWRVLPQAELLNKAHSFEAQ